MADKKKKHQRLKARQPRGFVDRSPADIRATDKMMAKIKEVYERYGFDPVETPMLEYTDALGKFLPDTDRPNEGVFSLQDDDEQWMSLRYDLTAPLARHFAQNINELQTPYRTYRAGWVFRNEKPGPGRFRQFMQFDADTVGAPNPSADAEMCMMMADTMEALGIARGDYVVRVNNRKVLDGLMEAIGLGGEENAEKRLNVLRALDKRDRLGLEGVRKLLSKHGRTDESGDHTAGVGLSDEKIDLVAKFIETGDQDQREAKIQTLLHAMKDGAEQLESLFNSWAEPQIEAVRGHASLDQDQVDQLMSLFGTSPGIMQPSAIDREHWGDDLFLNAKFDDGAAYRLRVENLKTIQNMRSLLPNNATIEAGLVELEAIALATQSGRYGSSRILIDPSIVRGLEYYTGPVYECELTFPVTNEKGETVQFGSVAGGGRYDGLVKRFTGQDIPATGFSIGVSRLMTALKNLGKLEADDVTGPVVVCVMDRDTESLAGYQQMVQDLRKNEIRAEMYQGNPKQFGKQLQYADRRGSPIAIIQGSDERAAGEVQVKDLILGAKLSEEITDNEEWRASRPAQQVVKVEKLVETVKAVLAAQASERQG